jgi:NADH-ubiquinone oxidoreductase chain 2
MLILIYSNFLSINLLFLIICSSILIKRGTAPFHFWFPRVIEGLNWNRAILLITWQKLAPLMILSYCLRMKLLIISIILSLLFGRLGGLNQTSFRKLMAFSSINHLGWIIRGIIYNEILWITYFIFYIILRVNIVYLFNNFKLFNINQTFNSMINRTIIKLFLFIVLLSLGGLPPFLGFFPKWLIIEIITLIKIFAILLIIIVFTLITLFFYLRICYSALLINNTRLNWNIGNNFIFIKSYKICIFITFFSLFGLVLLNFMFIFI